MPAGSCGSSAFCCGTGAAESSAYCRQALNVTTLSACRQYADDSAAPVPQQKAEEPQLPAGIYLNLKLETRITFDQSAVGDPVSARLDRAFRATGISVPKGTLVSGHIRRIEERYQPEKHYL